MNIREALQRGDVSEAIARVNDLNPEVSVWVVYTDDDAAESLCRDDSKLFMHHAQTLGSVMRLFTPKLQSSI